MGRPKKYSPGEKVQPFTGKRFAYIHIWASSEEIRVLCSDPKTIRVLIRSVQQSYPASKIDTRKDLADQVYSVKIQEIEPEDRYTKIAWWLFKMLCEQGWEPMETGENMYKMKACQAKAEA